MTNGTHSKPLSESDKKIQHLLSPVKDQLARAHGAQRKKIPDDMLRLKIIKASLLKIGDHITSIPNTKEDPSLELGMWNYVSDRHWPQSTKEDKRVSGKKLKDMYVKITGKDAAVPKSVPSKDAAKEEPNGTPDIKKEAKKEPSPAEASKPTPKSPKAVKDEDKMDVDIKSPA